MYPHITHIPGRSSEELLIHLIYMRTVPTPSCSLTLSDHLSAPPPTHTHTHCTTVTITLHYCYFHHYYCVYYCIGYTSNNDWSTSEIPLDQYQEKLQERRREWEESQPVQKEIDHQLQEKVMDYTRREL